MAIEIRHAEITDIEAIKSIYAQPHAYEGTLQLPNPSLELWTKRFNSNGDNYHNLVALIDGKVVGQLGLMTNTRPRRKHCADFGMAVCSSALREGVGSALLNAAIDMCDNWLNVSRIELGVFTDNSAAIGLYKKHGFLIEGEQKNYAFKNGSYADVYLMARLK